ncbi:MAG: 3-phosphoshikimate 1-carboxyvinyltransferase [Candidatus Omnitrophota bacterium]
MIIHVQPCDSLKGQIAVPSSKSYSIRAFLVAARGGSSRIINPSLCDDARVSISVAKSLGARITVSSGNIWKAVAGEKKTKIQAIDVRESGTVLRLLLPLLPLYTRKAVVRGRGTLRGRPNLPLTRTLRRMGLDIRGQGEKESIPISFQGGELKGGRIKIDGSLSSQFISALLIACPSLDDDSRLCLSGKKVVSRDYIAMTQQVLRRSGIQVKQLSARSFFIPGRQKFRGLEKFIVPADYGLAAFTMAAAALTRSEVILQGYFDDNFIQADRAILGFLRKMGVRFTRTARKIGLRGPFELSGGNFSLKDAPDLVPIMAVLALFAKGKTRLYDIQHVRAKESDRIGDLKEELSKIGAKIVDRSGEMIIYPQRHYRNNMLLDPHHDHRLAMSFCVLGLKLGVRVKDVGCIDKSYPRFMEDLKILGVKCKKAK